MSTVIAAAGHGLLLIGLGAIFLALLPWSLPLAGVALAIWKTS